MIKVLGTDDSVNSCECCGKTNLKFTVVVEVDGEIKHYGSTCATRHTGKTASEIKHDIDSAYAERLNFATAEFKSCSEYLAQCAAYARAHREGLVGKLFRDATRAESDAANVKRTELVHKFNVRSINA